MKLELQSASNFLVHLIRLGHRNINEAQLDKFQHALVEVLRRRYRDHWFPDKPFKGSGYRCIRMNGKVDPVIIQASESCGVNTTLIHSTFPSELTMWIDPLEVSYRIGENGSICVLYEFKDGHHEPWRPSKVAAKISSEQAVISSPGGVNKNKGGCNLNHNSKNNRNTSGQVLDNALSSSSPSSKKVVTLTSDVDSTPCKDSIRKMDFLLDPRKSVSIEQLAAYVSS